MRRIAVPMVGVLDGADAAHDPCPLRSRQTLAVAPETGSGDA